MAFDNFKPTLWMTGLQHNFAKLNVSAGLTNRSIVGETISYGQKAIINSIGEVNVNSYTGSVSYQTINDYSLEMLIDQKKYFAVEVDDVDAAQAKPDIMAGAMVEIAKATANDPDYYITGLYTQAAMTEGTTGSPKSITSATIINVLADVKDKMSDNLVRGDLVAIVPSWFITKIGLSRISKDTDNSAIMTNGYAGRFMGFDFYESDNVRHSGSTWYAPMFFKRGGTIAFAFQYEKIEAGRRDASMKDYMRGLMIYGAKAYRPDSLLTLYCAKGAES